MLPLLAVLCGVGAGSCVTAQDGFVGSRLEELCNGSIPACDLKASCVLGEDRFIRRTFPGGERLIVRTELPDQRLSVRMLLGDLVSPGTELVVEARSPTCAAADRERLVDVDLFELAGDDLTLDVVLELPEPGDHLVEIFSDMSASYLLLFELDG
ncbi:MAG: hypothetical protein H6744_05370 [Deltaproteobacteria bacterium]|nr:hypothetical protein [Deltaproteobacteria bacterium]MCB9786108.1 hypothetical protein [Deltaproteobacteria bacterium]